MEIRASGISDEDAQGMVMRILLDTNVFVAARNRDEPFHSQPMKLIELVDTGRIKCVVPTLVIAELCAGYHQEDDEKGLHELLTALLTTPNYEITPMDDKTACEAGKLRSRLSLRLPNAIIVATALDTGANTIVTYDEQLKKAENYVAVKT
ncbi:MAG: PIN domain-containing protein, partial [Candidatus Caldarchaeum sp.]